MAADLSMGKKILFHLLIDDFSSSDAGLETGMGHGV
jgi:hypothetical protein